MRNNSPKDRPRRVSTARFWRGWARPGNARSQRFVLCLHNDDYGASLEVGKVYRMLADEQARGHGLVRVIDESGEDYLFPAELFALIDLPRDVEQRLAV